MPVTALACILDNKVLATKQFLQLSDNEKTYRIVSPTSSKHIRTRSLAVGATENDCTSVQYNFLCGRFLCVVALQFMRKQLLDGLIVTAEAKSNGK